MIRRIRFIGLSIFLVLGLILFLVLLAAYIAFKIVLWLLPLIIVVLCVWAVMVATKKPAKKDPLDVKFKVK